MAELSPPGEQSPGRGVSPPSLLSEPPRAPAALKGVLPALSDPPHGRAPTARLGSCGPCTPSGVLREFTRTSALCPRAIRLEGQGVCPPAPVPCVSHSVRSWAVP